MNNYRKMETGGDSLWWQKLNRSMVIYAKDLKEWNKAEAKLKTNIRAELKS